MGTVLFVLAWYVGPGALAALFALWLDIDPVPLAWALGAFQVGLVVFKVPSLRRPQRVPARVQAAVSWVTLNIAASLLLLAILVLGSSA